MQLVDVNMPPGPWRYRETQEQSPFKGRGVKRGVRAESERARARLVRYTIGYGQQKAGEESGLEAVAALGVPVSLIFRFCAVLLPLS